MNITRWREFLILKMVLAFYIAQMTEFVPDEYWQSTEVAYYMHFGTGHLTWEWGHGLRSYFVPLMIKLMYQVWSYLEMELSPDILTALPQAAQLILTYIGICCFSDFAKARVGTKAGSIAYGLFIINWFTTYCGARTIANQTELSLNLIGLWLLTKKHYMTLAGVVALNFLMRPTAAIFWLPFIMEVGINILMDKRIPSYFVKCVRLAAIFCSGLNVLLVGSYLDFKMSGKLSWWVFFTFNFLEKGNAEFGTHPPLWYLTSALPSILGPLLPAFLLGLSMRGQALRLTVYSNFYIVVYSLLDHKEIRFLLPVTPLLFCVVGSVLNRVHGYLRKCDSKKAHALIANVWRYAMVGVVVLNIVAACFIGIFHQFGIRNASNYIYRHTRDMENPKVWIMTPCYNVPIHTLMPHPNIEFEYYVCAPKQFRKHFNTYTQLIQPNGFSTVNLERDVRKVLRNNGIPDYVMAFEPVATTILEVFDKKTIPYKLCASYRHTIIGDIHRRVNVLCKKSEKESEEIY